MQNLHLTCVSQSDAGMEGGRGRPGHLDVQPLYSGLGGRRGGQVQGHQWKEVGGQVQGQGKVCTCSVREKVRRSIGEKEEIS